MDKERLDKLYAGFDNLRPGQYKEALAFMYFYNKDYDEALKRYDEAIDEVSETDMEVLIPHYILSKAKVYYQKGETDKTWELFDEALSLDMKSNSYYSSLSLLSFLNFDAQLYEKAIKQAEHIIDFVQTKEFEDLNDDGPATSYIANAYVEMAYAYAKLDKIKEAEETFSIFLKSRRHEIISHADIDLCKILIEKNRSVDIAKDYILFLINIREKHLKEKKLPSSLGEDAIRSLKKRDMEHIKYLKSILEM